MKTYKDFVEFARLRYGTMWSYILSEARTAGFRRWQTWLYPRRMKWGHGGKQRFYRSIRRAGRAVWWCLVAFGLFWLTWRVNVLIETTIYKNKTIIARNAIYVCQQMPEICPSATKLVERAMK